MLLAQLRGAECGVDLTGEKIEVYRAPSTQGYGETQTRVRGQALTVPLLPKVELKVDEIFG